MANGEMANGEMASIEMGHLATSPPGHFAIWPSGHLTTSPLDHLATSPSHYFTQRSEDMRIQSYQDLEVWQRGMKLAEMAYRLTRDFPKEELFGMTSQIRRAASSIPANIAEGWGRQGSRGFQQFLRVAQGSLKELETHLILSHRVDLCAEAGTTPLLDESTILSKQIRSLIRSLQRREKAEP
jgi:four helix bundle protein